MNELEEDGRLYSNRRQWQADQRFIERQETRALAAKFSARPETERKACFHAINNYYMCRINGLHNFTEMSDLSTWVGGSTMAFIPGSSGSVEGATAGGMSRVPVHVSCGL